MDTNKRVWIKKEGLNKKGKELVDLFDKIQNADSTDKYIYKFYVQNRLKFDSSIFDNYSSAKEFELELLSNKKYQITKKEQLEDAVDFIFDILNNDMVHLTAHTDARTNIIQLTRIVELTNEKANDIFLDCLKVWTQSSTSSFIHQFVNQYMIKNANSYLSCYKFSENLKVRTEQGKTNTFMIHFEFNADNLNEELLEEIGTIVMNMPSFA